MEPEHLSAPPPVPEKHRALDGFRAGADRLAARIGDALDDAEEPILVTRDRAATTLSAVEDRITAALQDYEHHEQRRQR